jgi:hypothetical protein
MAISEVASSNKGNPMYPEIRWPDGKRFAFTIFDDPDSQSIEDSKKVYSLLIDLGFRTTKGVWPLGPTRTPNSPGETCANFKYRTHVLELQAYKFEVGYHNATLHSSMRQETIQGIEIFKQYFSQYPSAMANHYNQEAIYWGAARLSGTKQTIYNLVTLKGKKNPFFGHVNGGEYFWGDVCKEKIRYCRNFVYADINTLRTCPWMPYHDPQRPYVNLWYSSSEGAVRESFLKTISEANQDRLEEEGGACIMYTHFGLGFVERGSLNKSFRDLMTRLSKKNGWFVPVSTLLDYLRLQRGEVVLNDQQRDQLERRWLWEKLFRGTS